MFGDYSSLHLLNFASMLFFVSLLLFFFRRSYHFLNFLPIIFLIWLLQTLKYEQALYTSQKLKKKIISI